MMRSKMKGVSPDAPYIPETGSRKDTAIKREMTTNRSGKVDSTNMYVEVGVDPKTERTEVYRRWKPEVNTGMADTVIPDPDELEPTSRKVRERKFVDPGVGEETQIRIRSAVGSKSKRKVIRVAPLALEDVNTTVPVVGPKMTSTKEVSRRAQMALSDTRDISIQGPKMANTKEVSRRAQMALSDTRDVPIQGLNVPATRAKITPTFQPNNETYFNQEVEAPFNPLRSRKGGPNVPFAVSSGFECEFNPIDHRHQAKVKKAFTRTRIVIDQDPEVGVAVFRQLDFREKKVRSQVRDKVENDADSIDVTAKPTIRGKKKNNKSSQNPDIYDQVDIQVPLRAKDKRLTTRSHDVDIYERTEINNRPRSERTKSVREMGHSEIDHDMQMEIKPSSTVRREKDNVRSEMEIPEDGVYIDIGSLKGNRKVKKSKGRLPVSVTPFEGEVTISAKPLDGARRKVSDGNNLGDLSGAEEVQVSGKQKKTKTPKKSQQLEFELGPDDRTTDQDIRQSHKNPATRPELPKFTPTKDDQDVEIEKSKNVLVFT